MNKQEIIESIYKFSQVLKNEGVKCKYVSGQSSAIVAEVSYEEMVGFESESIHDVKWSVIKGFAESYGRGRPVHYTDPETDSGNWQASFEAVLANHPNVGTCYIDGRKHTRWFDYVVHKPGEIIKRDDFCGGKLDTSSDVDWTAPEWCLVVAVKRCLEDNPSVEGDLYGLLEQTTIYKGEEWKRKVKLLKDEDSESFDQMGSMEGSPTTGAEKEKARWYENFYGGDYGRWDSFFTTEFDSASGEDLAGRAVYRGDKGNELCEILGIGDPKKVSNEMAGSTLVESFILELRHVGMYVK